MLDWNDGDGTQDSDNTDDDDDDKPSDDGSDGSRPAYQPPDSDPRGGVDPKYHGGGSDRTDGGNSGGPQGGFFQFQLSQLDEGQSGSQSSRADQLIKPTSALQQTQQRTRCASEPLYEQSTEQPSSAGQWYTRGSLDAPKGDNTHALARDALSGPLAHREQLEGPALEAGQELPKDHHPTGVGIADSKTDWLDVLLKSRQRMTIGTATSAFPSMDTSCSRSTASHGSKASKPTGASSAARLDETEFTHIDDIVKSQVTTPANTFPVAQRSVQSSRSLPLDSKVATLAQYKNLSMPLTDEQALQAIPPTSQSFLSVRFLGSGGFSTVDEVVHCATNLRLGRKTLKNRDPAAIKELWKEVNVLQKLRHPHVIRFLGAYSKGDKMSILLSPIADTTLALWLDRFKQDKPANFGQVVTKMFGCLASSVRYLHEQRPVVKHMDIKPQNILIVEGDGEYPHVVLCDFGISSSEDLTDGRIQPLTRQYVAPEAFEGSTRKQAADIWSLGCVFAEMASVAFSQSSANTSTILQEASNSSWLDLRREFSGRATKYYWQDVPGLQNSLTTLLEEAVTLTEKTVVRTLKSMLSAQPDERPDAASLTMIFTPAPCCLSWPNDNAAYPGPQEELSSVEMLLHDDGVDCRARSTQHGQSAAGSEHGLSSAKSWIEQCSHGHEACGHAASSHTKTLPARLVDICPDGKAGPNIRVVDSTSIESSTGLVDYVALSHVWDRSDVVLSTDRLQTLQAEIPLSTLSHALIAAVTTARSLEYRYIWIDSLCILQDSDLDKRQECASMASTFRNAALTLVLDNVDTDCMADLKGSLAEAKPAFALDTRAWALQDRLLSHRFLHLGQEQMYWECNSLKASETFPQGLPSLLWEKVHTKLDGTQPHASKIDHYAAQYHPTQAYPTKDTLPGLTELKQASKPDHFTARVRHHRSSKIDRRARTPEKSKQANRLAPRRIRNCQWIKKEGDNIKEAAQTTLQIDNNRALFNTNGHGNEDGRQPHDAQATLSGAARAHACDNEEFRTGVFHGEHQNDTDTRTSDTVVAHGNAKSENLDGGRGNATSSSSDVSSCPSTDDASKEISMSGQLDQNGSLSGRNANGNGVVAMAAGKGDGRLLGGGDDHETV